MIKGKAILFVSYKTNRGKYLPDLRAYDKGINSPYRQCHYLGYIIYQYIKYHLWVKGCVRQFTVSLGWKEKVHHRLAYGL